MKQAIMGYDFSSLDRRHRRHGRQSSGPGQPSPRHVSPPGSINSHSPAPSPGSKAGTASLSGDDAGTPSNGRTGRAGIRRWAGAGFLAGIVFWHFVGFWNFLGDVVLHERAGPAAQTQRAGAAHHEASPPTQPPIPAPSKPVRRTVQGANLKDCSVLVLERASGRTKFLPCPAKPAAKAEKPARRRQDLAGRSQRLKPPQIADWSVTLEPGLSPTLAQGR